MCPTQGKIHFHGSDLEKIESIYGIKKENIINYGSNVNPLGISSKIKNNLPEKIELIASYPDRDYQILRGAIGRYVNITPENIIVGNGSTELISLCIKSVSPNKALILGPTYSEYEREINLEGGITTYYPLPEINDFKLDVNAFIKELNDDLDLLVICNPNNPTSTTIYNKDMEVIIDTCNNMGIFILIDETYVEFCEDMDKIATCALTNTYENVMVIRGVSKFFAAPGLRLGYGICSNKKHKDRINELKNPWTINALASYAGELMLNDNEYIQKTKNYMNTEREKIVSELKNWDFIHYYEPTANFVLIKILNKEKEAGALFEFLIKQGLMIRDASSFPFLDSYFFRFCFLKAEENDLLLSKIKEFLSV